MKINLAIITLLSATAVNAGLVFSRGSDCPVTDAEREKYLDNLEKQANDNCGQGCLNSIASFLSKDSRCSNAKRSLEEPSLFVRDSSGCPISDAERQKYQDNLKLQQQGKCGSGCQNSIASFQSKDSRCKANGKNVIEERDIAILKPRANDCPVTDAQRQIYSDNLKAQAQGRCDDFCVNAIAQFEATDDRCNPKRSTGKSKPTPRQNSDCPVTDAERTKYRDNLEKQAQGNCGQGCKDSIASFQSKDSRCSKAAAAAAADCPTEEERQKYLDNLVKQQQGNCGQGCKDSIGSYQSRLAKCQAAGGK